MKHKSGYPHILFVLIFGFFIISCNQESGPGNDQVVEDIITSGEVTLSESQISLAGFQFGRPQQKVLSGHVDAPGKLSLPNTARAVVSPVLEGLVFSIEISLGQTIKKGQVLAYLTDPEYIKIQNEYLNLYLSLELLENNYNRQKRLYNEQVTSQKQYIQAKTDFESAKAQLKSLDIMIRQIGLETDRIIAGNLYSEIPVKSPIDGIVNNIMISLGENVTKDDVMFEVSCRKNLWLELDVFEKDILEIREGQRVTFLLANSGNLIYEARVLTSGGAVLGNGRVVKVLATFSNEDQQLIPGMFVAAKIHTGEKEFNALPESAIMNSGTSNTYVYYTLDGAGSKNYTFKKIAVSTGYSEDGFVQVSFQDELPAPARVVINGGYYILAEEGGD